MKTIFQKPFRVFKSLSRKNDRLIAVCILFVFPVHLKAGEPWKLAAFDFYYSGNIYRYNWNGAELFAIDRASGSPAYLPRFRFDSSLMENSPYSRYSSAFHGDIVFTKWINRKRLSSYDLRIGVSYSGMGREKYFNEDASKAVIEANEDTVRTKVLSYGFKERSMSIHCAWLINWRLGNNVAVYAGPDLLFSPFYEMKGEVRYSDTWTAGSPSVSGFTTVDQFRISRQTATTFSALAGVKFNLDCWWNMFLEYQYGTRISSVLDSDRAIPVQSFKAGFRYKFGRHDPDNSDQEKGLFW